MFEFDPAKSETNKAKHGVDFLEAQALWNDDRRVEVPAKTAEEERWLVVGKLAGKLWSAVVTRRGDRVRIISVRRSRVEEVKIYEGE